MSQWVGVIQYLFCIYSHLATLSTFLGGRVKIDFVNVLKTSLSIVNTLHTCFNLGFKDATLLQRPETYSLDLTSTRFMAEEGSREPNVF